MGAHRTTDHAKVLSMRDAGESFGNIAKVLGINPQTVITIVRRRDHPPKAKPLSEPKTKRKYKPRKSNAKPKVKHQPQILPDRYYHKDWDVNES